MAQPLRLLVVEDSRQDAELLLFELERDGFSVVHRRVDSRDGLMDALEKGPWDCIVSDYSMPHFSGLDALTFVRSRGVDLPFIILSGAIGEDTAVAAMKAGANDYVMKDHMARLGPAIERELRDAADRRERRRIEEARAMDALYDTLTGLANRALFLDRLDVSLDRARRGGAVSSVLFVGFSRFKSIIDSIGHLGGDDVLVEIARRLEAAVLPADTVARVGGKEFAVLSEAPGDPGATARAIIERLAVPVLATGQEIYLSAAVGIAPALPAYLRAEDVLRDANTAMNRAALRTNGRIEMFDPGMHERAVSLFRLENDLRRAAEKGELEPWYQPVVGLADGGLKGFECLLRWRHPERGLVPPEEFIRVAEDSGQILEIGPWVLKQACRQAVEWRRRGFRVTISVNLSARQFTQPDLADRVRAALEETGLEAGGLMLEITETVLMEDVAATTRALASLKTLGVHVHVDDFGTGYSSLSYLQRFPIDALKIDRSFVSRMDTHVEDVEIVKTILALAHAKGIEVVAEGVETSAQAAKLKDLRCEFAQGFHFGKPADARVSDTLMAEGGRFHGVAG